MFELSFSKNIKKFRKDNNLSQEEFANMLQVSRPTVIAYEKGTTEPTLYVLFRAAKVMNCSLDSLVGIDTPDNKTELYSKIDDYNALELEQDLKNKINTLDGLIKKYRRSFDELTMSKKRTDRMFNEFTMAKKRADRMLDELTMTKKRNDLIYEELKRAINRVSKSEDELMSIIDAAPTENSHFTNDNYTEYEYISIPEYGSIACGSPNEIEDSLINFVELPVIAPLTLNNAEDYFIITASGESMNQVCQNGDKIILISTNYGYMPHSGDIVAIAIDDCITLKELTLSGDKVILKPKSNNPEFTDHTYKCNDFNTLEVKGKFICTVNQIQDKIKELSK